MQVRLRLLWSESRAALLRRVQHLSFGAARRGIRNRRNGSAKEQLITYAGFTATITESRTRHPPFYP